jgi:hypothetical protein
MIQQSIQRDDNDETGNSSGVAETANAVMVPPVTAPVTTNVKPVPVKPDVKAIAKPVHKPATVINKPVQKPKATMKNKNDY